MVILPHRRGAFRSAGFNPVNYGTVSLWTSPIKQGSGTVSQINDYSGTGRHFTQGLTSKQPTYSSTALNGYPAFVSDGIDDEMTGATWTLPSSGTLMVVAQPVARGNFTRLYEHGANSQLAVCNSADSNGWRVQLGGSSGVQNNTGTGVVLIAISFSSTGFNWWMNGAAQSSYSGSYAPASAVSYLFRYGGGSYYGAFRLGDLVIWEAPLSAGVRAAAQTALGSAYGLTL